MSGVATHLRRGVETACNLFIDGDIESVTDDPLQVTCWRCSREPALRASTMIRRLHEDMAHDLANKIQAAVDASGACDKCGREERDPVVGLIEPQGRFIVACPWCSGDAVLEAWRAEARLYCPNLDCHKHFDPAELREGLVPYHDFPPPCRAVCLGSKNPPMSRDEYVAALGTLAGPDQG